MIRSSGMTERMALSLAQASIFIHLQPAGFCKVKEIIVVPQNIDDRILPVFYQQVYDLAFLLWQGLSSDNDDR